MSAERATEAIRLRDDEGLDAAQIARRLGVGSTIAYKLLANGGKVTTCRGCGVEIPVQGRSFPRKWCADCGAKVSPRKKGKVDEEEMDAAVLRVAEQARASGSARPAPGPVTSRRDPSIVREKTYSERACRGCGTSFKPTTPARWFCDDCKEDR